MTSLPRLKARVKSNFASALEATDGLSVTKENGVYTASLAFDDLAETGTIAEADLGNFEIAALNTVSGSYARIALDTISDAMDAVQGPASATDNNIAIFDGATGDLIKDGGKGLPTGAIVGTTDTQTLSNKTLTAPNIGAATGTSLNVSGAVVAGTDITAGASSVYAWSARSQASSPADGNILLRNAAATSFDRLQLGGTTNSFPSLKRSSTGVDFRLADDSGFAPIQALTGTFNGFISTSGTITILNGTAIPAGGTANLGYLLSSTAGFGMFFGSGAPDKSQAMGSIYLRSNGLGVPYYNFNGTTGWDALVGASAAQTLTNKTLTAPVLGTSYSVTGSSSGTITVQPQAAAGTYNFNLPTSAGTSGQPLLSGGGGATAQSYGTVGNAAGGTNIVSATDPAATFVSRTLNVGISGSTNNSSSGSGAYVSMTPTASIPANYITTNRMLKIKLHFLFTTGSAAPQFGFKVRLGGTDVVEFAPTSTANNMTTKLYTTEVDLVGMAAPGASSNTMSAILGNVNAISNAALLNAVSQPVALATNGSLTLDIQTQWATAGTGTNTVQLLALIVETAN